MTTRPPRKKGHRPAPKPPTAASVAMHAEDPLFPSIQPADDVHNPLRKTAEAQLAASMQDDANAPADPVLHELRVHQIELEMQNEALHEAQVILEESRDRYLDLYEMAPVGYLTLSVDGTIQEINLYGAQLLQGNRQTLLNRQFSRYVVHADQHAWHLFWQQALQGNELQRGEIDLQGRDGAVTSVRVKCAAMQVAGELRGVRLALSDITDLKQMLADLQTREDRLQLATAASGLGLFDDHLINNIHMVDNRVREIWGFEPDTPVTFQQVLDGVHPDDRQAMQATLARALNSRGDGHYVAQYRVLNRATGVVHHVAALGRVYYRGGQAMRIIGTVKDITEHVQLEEEVRARRHAMELLAHQQIASQTAAAIAHEINQPLISVSAFSEAALHMLRDGVKHKDKLQRALEGAVQQSQRAGRALHELLDFLHKGETTTESLDLNQVVSEAIRFVEQGNHCVCTIDLEQDPDLPPVLINRLQIQKVVVNLVQNACEAMQDMQAMQAIGQPEDATKTKTKTKTKAKVKVKVTVRQMADIPMAQVSVYDNGPGFSAESMKRAFDPFFTTKTNGIGLGLAISRALVEANGGQLWVDPAPESGALLHFSLPFAS